MPCYDARGNEPTTRYASGISPDELNEARRATKLVLDKLIEREAMLCALFNEMENRGIAHALVVDASRNGLIGLMEYWDNHSKSDETRLAKELHKYSVHEQAILKDLLNK